MKLLYDNNLIILTALSFLMITTLIFKMRNNALKKREKKNFFSSDKSKKGVLIDEKELETFSVFKILDLMQEMPIAGLKTHLSKRRDEDFVGIAKKCKDFSRHAKMYIAGRLAYISKAPALDDLVYMIADKNTLVRNRAKKSIAFNKYEQKNAWLIQSTENCENECVKSTLLEIMGDLGDDFFTDTLVSQLKGKCSSSAADSLLRCGNIKALDLINMYLKKIDNELVEELLNIFPENQQAQLTSECKANNILEFKGSPDIEMEPTPLPEYVLHEIVEEVDKKELIPLLKRLNDTSGAPEVRYKAACRLGKIGSILAKGQLINVLNDSEATVRYGAIQALTELKAKDAANRILERLNDNNEFVRSSAAHALETLGDVSMCDDFRKAYGDTSKNVRYSVLNTLAKLDPLGSMEVFRKALDDKEESIRITALEIIGKLKDKGAVGPVVKLLEKSKGRLRDICGDVLMKIGDFNVVSPLLDMIKQVDQELLDIASKSRRIFLEQRKMNLNLEDAIAAGDDQSLYLSSLNAGQNRDNLNLESIEKAIDSDSIFVASSAIISFARKCTPEEGIMKLTQKVSHKSAYVRESTARGLGMIGTYDAVHILEKMSRDRNKEVRFAVARSLGEIVSSDSRKILGRMIKDRDMHVKNAVKKSLDILNSTTSEKKMIFIGDGLTRE